MADKQRRENGIDEDRRARALAEALRLQQESGKAPTAQADNEPTQAPTDERGDVAAPELVDAPASESTDVSTHESTDEPVNELKDATVLAAGLKRIEEEDMVRRTFTVARRHDNMLDAVAHLTKLDKGEVLRQVLDMWMAGYLDAKQTK